jgi:hypothetical protein
MYNGYTETPAQIAARQARRNAQHEAALATQATPDRTNTELTLEDCLQIERELNHARAEKMRAYLLGLEV